MNTDKPFAFTADHFRSLPPEEQEFWGEYLIEAIRAIGRRESVGRKPPFRPTQRLLSLHGRALELGGSRFRFVQALERKFDL